MKRDSLISILVGVIIVVAGIYVAWKLIKAVGFILIAVGVVFIAARVFRRST